MEQEDVRSRLPQVERLLGLPEVSAYFERISRPLAARAVSRVLAAERQRLTEEPDSGIGEDELLAAVIAALDELDRRRIRKVVNGTGIVLHTNLGRSPLSPAAWKDAAEAVEGYSNLEFEVEAGKRGRRGGLSSELLRALTGAEDALVVNNNAAAMVLALACFASGKDVLVSRGEAVQIGGGFRVPDILAMSGARLKEVGTTNVTTEEDYLNAIDGETAVALSVHASNFAIRGFTRKPDLSLLSAALPKNVILIADQGSGCCEAGVPAETPVRNYLRDGVRLVCFSCDKILGGPQAGAIVGDAALIARLSRHPLMRAFRPGKVTLAVLERCLVARLRGNPGNGDEPPAGSPVERALRRTSTEGIHELKALGRRVIRRLPKASAILVESRAAIGGGSSPDETLPSFALVLKGARGAESLLAALRLGRVPLIGRVESSSVIVDLLTLADEDDKLVSNLILEALEKEGGS
ncbi:MAG: L-seryl-tRNA(Sec) selenium transferase [Treponema sp. RIFOXYC1_FULL_61_9]|nr:MAG: L-seryl-tRNA(Sec) selenium transferase [Treponema sp. RIFOXYC1_FULL_61_9]